MQEYLWKEQLDLFEKSFLFPGVTKKFMDYMNSHKPITPKKAQSFLPNEALKLYTAENNIQYHLNGRSIFGVQRMWNLIKDPDKENNYLIQTGCSINPGLIQFDHSGFIHGRELARYIYSC